MTEFRRFRGTERYLTNEELGRIILDLQVSIPAREAWLFRNTKALFLVRRGLQDAADGKTVTYRDVSALADHVES
jgi:hypothetical protein